MGRLNIVVRPVEPVFIDRFLQSCTDELPFEISKKSSSRTYRSLCWPLGAWGRVSEEGGSAGSLPAYCQAICQALRLFPTNKATDAVSKSLRYTVTER